MPNRDYMQPQKYVQYTTEEIFYIFYFLMLLAINVIFFLKLVQCNGYLVRKVGIDGLGFLAWGQVWMGSPSLKAIDLGIGQSGCLWPGALWQKKQQILFNTKWPRQMSHYFTNNIFKLNFLKEYTYIYWFTFDRSLFIRVKLTLSQCWFRQWIDLKQGTCHYLKQWCLVYWHTYVSLSLNELIMTIT